jgi:REP element-mobilizing transposase RayT
MPIADKYLANLTEGTIYHIYNRTNNKELLFKSDENRRFFLQRFTHYLSPYLDTYCWCLLPNHFHFLIRVKTASEIKAWLQQQEILKPSEKTYLEGKESSSRLLEKAFQQFFTSYSMAFNKMYGRAGNLFHRPFKRIEINKESHFTQAIVYIHANPLKHKLVDDFTLYYWSSWKSVISEAPTQLLRNELIEWFGNKNQLIKAHQDLTQYYYESDIAIEE